MVRQGELGVLMVMMLIGWIFVGDVDARATRVKRDDELHSIGLSGLHVIGTRFINEHHEVFDYPGDKDDDDDDDSLAADEDPDKYDDDDDEEEKDYHNPIYDHVHIEKDDYSEFGHVDKDDEYPKKSHGKHKD